MVDKDDDFRNSISNVYIGGNAHQVQIQQNTKDSNQTIYKKEEFNYENVAKVLKEIKEYSDLPKFNSDFNEKAETIRKCVNDTLEMVDNKEEPQKVKKSLSTLKELVIGTSGSLIASGIISLIGSLL